MMFQLGSFLSIAVMAATIASFSTAAEEKAVTAKQVMKACTGKDGLCAKTVGAGKAGNWEEAQKLGKEFKEYGATLANAKPKKGDAESWKTLTTKFAADSAAVAAAADKKDVKALLAAGGAFGGSCKGCHSVHK